MTGMRLLRLTVFIVVLLGLCHRIAGAQTVQDRLISSTFKTLAKTYIATTDFNTLKKNTIARLEQLDTDSFHEKYPRVLQIINDAPALQKQFGLRSDMSVERAISVIKSLDKKKVSAMIDAVPDQVVARRVAEDISSASQSVNSKNVLDQVTAVWRNLQDRLDRTAGRSPQ
jgi:uncharacterized membrane protein YccC